MYNLNQRSVYFELLRDSFQTIRLFDHQYQAMNFGSIRVAISEYIYSLKRHKMKPK